MEVVVLPGLDGTGLMLTEFAARLSVRYPVAVVAYPGDRALSYPELADFVVARLPRDGRFVLVAESFAGPLAILLAAGRPAGLAGIAFVASFMRCPVPVPTWLSRLASLLPLRAKALQALMRPLTHGRWSSEAEGASLSKALAPIRHGVLAARLRAVAQADYREAFSRLDLPMFYLRPRQDRLVRAAAVLEMARINPALAVRTIDGPHFVLQTRGAEAAAVLGGFIESLAAP